MKNGKAVPHTAIIFTDSQERNKLMRFYLKKTNASWSSLTVLSAQPDSDVRFFRSMASENASRRKRTAFSMVDVRDMLAGANPARRILSVVREAESSPKSRPLVIGVWPYAAYGAFEVVLEVERTEAEEGMTGILCGYRCEGFWSLAPGQISEVFELHRRVLLGSRTFEMRPT